MTWLICLRCDSPSPRRTTLPQTGSDWAHCTNVLLTFLHWWSRTSGKTCGKVCISYKYIPLLRKTLSETCKDVTLLVQITRCLTNSCINTSLHSVWSCWQMSRLMTKPTKWFVHPAKTQISLGICPVCSESLLCALCVAKDPTFHHADSKDSDQTGRRLGGDWADAQADNSPHWAHRSFCRFSSWGGSVSSLSGGYFCMFNNKCEYYTFDYICSAFPHRGTVLTSHHKSLIFLVVVM